MLLPTDLTAVYESAFGRALSQPALNRLLEAGQPREWLKDYTAFTQYSKPEDVYILIRGRVSLVAERSDGEQAVVDIANPGDIFPLLPLVLNQPASLGAQTITSVQVIAVPVSIFRQQLRADAELASAVMQHLARQWSGMAEQNKALKLQSTNQRLARFLLQHTDTDDGAVEVRLQDERRLLARRLGMTPESLSRAINHLLACGVEFHQQRVLIRDVDRLRQFCGLEVVT